MRFLPRQFLSTTGNYPTPTGWPTFLATRRWKFTVATCQRDKRRRPSYISATGRLAGHHQQAGTLAPVWRRWSPAPGMGVSLAPWSIASGPNFLAGDWSNLWMTCSKLHGTLICWIGSRRIWSRNDYDLKETIGAHPDFARLSDVACGFRRTQELITSSTGPVRPAHGRRAIRDALTSMTRRADIRVRTGKWNWTKPSNKIWPQAQGQWIWNSPGAAQDAKVGSIYLRQDHSSRSHAHGKRTPWCNRQ